jgi:hypothetical protein
MRNPLRRLAARWKARNAAIVDRRAARAARTKGVVGMENPEPDPKRSPAEDSPEPPG